MKAQFSKFFKYFLRFLWTIVGGLVFYVLAATVFTLIPTNGGAEEAQEGIGIYLISNGFHIDVALPAQNETFDWYEFVEVKDFSVQQKAPYIAFGWGDRGFFYDTPRLEDLTFNTAFKAIFLPSPSVMHVILIGGTPIASESVKKIVLTPQQYQKLVLHIKSGFALDKTGKVKLEAGDGYGNLVDNFYTGKGSYSLLNTCNNWINTGLKQAGVKTATWAPFTASVLYHRE